MEAVKSDIQQILMEVICPQRDLCEGFYSPRASLLQRAEAGEGLTPDYAIGSSGGVSAGRHDLGDAGRHTWGRDSHTDPSHTDSLTIIKHPVSQRYISWVQQKGFFFKQTVSTERLTTVQGALYNTEQHEHCVGEARHVGEHCSQHRHMSTPPADRSINCKHTLNVTVSSLPSLSCCHRAGLLSLSFECCVYLQHIPHLN